MIQHVRLKWLIAILVLALPAAVAEAATIITVPVGNTGNSDDTWGDGYGAVSDAYNIGKYEVTNTQYAAFLTAVAATTDTYSLYNNPWMGSGYGGITRTGGEGSYSYSAISGREDKPVNYVSWGDAARFANWLHNDQGSGDTESGAYTLNGATSNEDLLAVSRNADATWVIPTEDEWYKAAYYDGGTSTYYDYPTGSDSISTASANYDNSVVDVTDVGAYTGSASPYGTFDQGGNLWEWNEAIIYGSSRGLRGGSFYTFVFALQASGRYNATPTDEERGVGFRVASSAAIPEPGSVLVWAGLGIIGMIWLRRRR